ncbi:hypothetical protein JR316_0011573 [Psilocybe cubensis]|uniref:Uncharacterized protein n=1 Tax=Psilocybe cubensis TaxID=181762 RepID=A0ACB8GJW8_PSICU|nr:hypothetical protein JR316_0011573 [Psilocybe cubensis]KAH9476005.1 hypothetical protein JR316_0011573 [Psilocybe cubensis]
MEVSCAFVMTISLNIWSSIHFDDVHLSSFSMADDFLTSSKSFARSVTRVRNSLAKFSLLGTIGQQRFAVFSRHTLPWAQAIPPSTGNNIRVREHTADGLPCVPPFIR